MIAIWDPVDPEMWSLLFKVHLRDHRLLAHGITLALDDEKGHCQAREMVYLKLVGLTDRVKRVSQRYRT